jgi:copper transport protein
VSPRVRIAAVLVAVGAALAVPTVAAAHAYLIRASPAASVTVNSSPAQISLTYSEAVAPRFALVSVTDADGNQEVDGRPQRSPGDPSTIQAPLKDLRQGWYLVFWRAISADGHPVRGAFTFAVGPNTGPPPQFVIPSIAESAAQPRLVVARWLVFLFAMAAIGLFALRTLIARPLAERVPGASLGRLSLAFGVSLVLALVVLPAYVVMATAQFALRSTFDLGNVVPLLRDSSFGRSFLDLELVLALFAVAAAVAIRVDRPERGRRSVAELVSLTGALGCAAAALLVPGLGGHAAQTSPRGLLLALDWLHLAAGSIWVGGLIGLLVLWWSLGERRAVGLAFCVPRFSRVAFGSVVLLLGTGVGASIVHLPTFASLWQTSYGDALIAKSGLLLTAMALGAVNLLRTTPRLEAGAAGAVALLRRTVGGEVLLLAGALFAAAILTSLAPPPRALASIGRASARVGPGPAVSVVRRGPYRVELRVTPNKVAVPNDFSVRVTKAGKPVRSAEVTATFTMLDMEMPQLSYTLPEREPGVFSRSAPALVMVGRWGLSFEIRPPGGSPLEVLLLDRATG